ncbi:DUF4368 domain-containing protein [Anaerostipes caccae]|uniref:DUF4368 domain-containing protein n=1 Tax=Anaerostipes caccae TaxID=105841 RepID=UPI002279B143|nr:DUF4368 domain-containing protein [Anaerostipes caccae]
MLYCADCGSKLHFATGKNITPEQDCYRCARYKSNTGDCTMHYIRKETLKLSAEYETEQKELTPTIVNEFAKKIIVHAPHKSSGHRRQKIHIIWNFFGELEQNEDAQTIERQRKSRAA